MGVEELSQGRGFDREDDDPPGLGSLAWVGIALAGVIAVVLLGGRHHSSTQAEPTPTAPVQTFTAQPIPGPTARSGAIDPGQSLNIGQVCAPVTDHSTSLTLTFQLINFGSDTVTVTSVKALLPLRGLHPTGPVTAGGDCAHPGTAPVGGLLFPGQKQLFTMHFRLPRSCPQPLPVQAVVRLRVGQMVGTTTVPVMSDLGSIRFDSCP